MSWKMKGAYFETCSCEFMCPCHVSLSHGATYDRCRMLMVFDIAEGVVEGVDVGGLRAALFADTPKVMTDGDWRVGIFIDDRSTQAQADRLLDVLGGHLGGPIALYGPLMGEILGVVRARFEIEESGHRHRVRIGEAVEFELEDVVPFGADGDEPARLSGIVHPAGSELVLAEATYSRINAFGVEYFGRAALTSSSFSWAA